MMLVIDYLLDRLHQKRVRREQERLKANPERKYSHNKGRIKLTTDRLKERPERRMRQKKKVKRKMIKRSRQINRR